MVQILGFYTDLKLLANLQGVVSWNSKSISIKTEVLEDVVEKCHDSEVWGLLLGRSAWCHKRKTCSAHIKDRAAGEQNGFAKRIPFCPQQWSYN